jgi:hypothetical protein
MIRQFFKPAELKVLLNSYYFSVLYYNSEIWLTPFLQSSPKQQLLSASSNAVRSCLNYPNNFISSKSLHKKFKKSTPDQMVLYQTSLLLYKTSIILFQAQTGLNFLTKFSALAGKHDLSFISHATTRMAKIYFGTNLLLEL